MNNTYCISTKQASYRSDSKAAIFGPTEPLKPDKIARIQIEPAEAYIAPGESIKFAAKGFDKNGIAAGDVKVSFAITGLEGEMAADGTFVAAGTRIKAGKVTATSGQFSSIARVRVVPAVPYEENFDSLKPGLPPEGWITSKLKCQVSEHEGKKVLRKLADRPSPPFARLRCYVMPPIPAGYTVKSDMLGVSKKKRFLPDMGLINSGYLLILTGTSERTRKLRIVSWSPVPRIISEIEFPWEPDTWYSAKLSFDQKDGKGVIRAKVWLCGDREPGEWTLTMEDPCPNPGGSPGLYAYSVAITSKSKGTEVLFDNVAITPNRKQQ
jgi:hypothetical protein